VNRSRYFDVVEEKLHILATRIEGRGKLNILDLHLHSENFYQNFLNLLFGWNLQNANQTQQNVEGFDLIDVAKTILAQVSATATKAKIESALTKNLSVYAGYFLNLFLFRKMQAS
jgi:hypothetical protein